MYVISNGVVLSEDWRCRMFKKSKMRIFTFSMAGILAFTPVVLNTSNVHADDGESIEDVEQKKKENEAKINEAKGKLKDLEKEKDNVSSLIKDLDTEITGYQEKISDLNIRKNELQTEISLAEIKIQNALYEEQLQYDNMKTRIQYAYENDDVAYIDALMHIEDYKNMLNNAEYTSQISTYDQIQLNRLSQIRDTVNTHQVFLEGKLKEVESVKQEATNEQDALQVMLDGKRELLGEYDAHINLTADEIAELEAQTEAFDAQILEMTQAAAAAEEARRQAEAQRREEERQRREEEARREVEDASPGDADSDSDDSYYDEPEPTYYTGGALQWPMPSSDYISSYFGGRSAPTAGASTYHQAIDIGCDSGSAVVSAEAGTVTSVGYNEARGYYIVVYHGNNLSTLYQHLSGYAVGNGEYVSRGQVIAYSGETGYCSGPHLHFEVIVGDERVDPLLYLR